MNSKTINGERQNKLSLIVTDLAKYASKEEIYQILLRRGVFKWFAARRDIIKLKNRWKDRVTVSILMQKKRHYKPKAYWQGYRRGVEQCRAEVRAICHSPRWRAPDNDEKAIRWLEEQEIEEAKEAA